jgi:hypothetical protein
MATHVVAVMDVAAGQISPQRVKQPFIVLLVKLPVGLENPSQPSTGRLAPVSSRGLPLIMVMQPTHLWDFPDRANLRPLDRPWYRTIHVQCPVRSPGMVVREVAGQGLPEMALVQDDHVVQAVAADTPDQPLDVRILPWTLWGDQHFFDAHVSQPSPKGGAIDAVSIAPMISDTTPGPRLGHEHEGQRRVDVTCALALGAG